MAHPLECSTKFTVKDLYWGLTDYITTFEMQCGTRGTHIPTNKPRDYIGQPGEILIDDEVSRDKPYAKIGNGKTSFDELDYITVVKDYYGTY